MKLLLTVLALLTSILAHAQTLQVEAKKPVLGSMDLFEDVVFGSNYDGDKTICLSKMHNQIYEVNLSNLTKKVVRAGLKHDRFKNKEGLIVMDQGGNYVLDPAAGGQIYRLRKAKPVKTIAINQVLKKHFEGTGREVVYTTIARMMGIASSRDFVFGFWCTDSLALNGNMPFMRYPAAGIFDFKTQKVSFIGAMPDTFRSGRTRLMLISLVFDDTLTNEILVSFSNSLGITAYDRAGKVLRQSSTLPDSVIAKYKLYDQYPVLYSTNERFSEVRERILHSDSSHLYTTLQVTRLNKDLIAVQTTRYDDCKYIVYDNQLRYVGLFSFGGTRMGFSHYLNNESIFTGFTWDERSIWFKRQAVLVGVR